MDMNVTDDCTPPPSNPRHPRIEASARQRQDERQQHQERRLSAAVVDVRSVSGHEAEEVHRIITAILGCGSGTGSRRGLIYF
jgi:hypothetical protein